jgi:hypothetical protein
MHKLWGGALGAALLLSAAPALAAGMTLHLWMTEKGVEKLRSPDLKRLMQKHRNAWRSGSSYPDAGYSPSFFKQPKYYWGEESHWGPFQHAYLEQVKATCGGKYTTDDRCGQLVAHFMGAVAHGLQDETFDELFVEKVREMDGGGQELTDTGLDMIALVTHPSRVKAMPLPYYAPATDLEKVYQERMGFTPQQANKQQIIRAAIIMQAGHVGERFAALPTFRKHQKAMPWGSRNYLTAPGGVEHSGQATARLWEYLWDRLHGREGLAPERLTTVPAAGATNVAPDRRKTDSKVTVIFDRAIVPASVTEQSFFVVDPQGRNVPGHHRFIYVGAGKTRAEGHIAAFYPHEDLRWGTTYKVVLTNAIVDDRQKPVFAAGGHSFTFTTVAEPPYRTLRVGGLCLEASGKANNSPVVLARCSGTRAQHWIRDGQSRFHSREQENRCLDAIGSLTSILRKGTRAALYDCHGKANQKWHDGERGSLRWGLFKKLALTAGNVREGERPKLALYSGKPGQSWEVSKELGAAPPAAPPAPKPEAGRRVIHFGFTIKKPKGI